jgi:RNA polymerase sigma-70 factor (ECF subfamily)
MTCTICSSLESVLRESHRASLRNLTPEDLMVRFQQGCTAAFDELYERYAPRIAAYFRWRRGPWSADAADAAQAAFTRLIQYRMQFNTKRLFYPWLLAIARNTTWSAYRRLRGVVLTALTPNVRDEELDQENIELRRWIADLPADLRKVIELTYFAGMTSPEAGELLRIPPGTVDSRKHRAIAALRARAIEKCSTDVSRRPTTVRRPGGENSRFSSDAHS